MAELHVAGQMASKMMVDQLDAPSAEGWMVGKVLFRGFDV